jgi:hypothetical protein
MTGRKRQDFFNPAFEQESQGDLENKRKKSLFSVFQDVF